MKKVVPIVFFVLTLTVSCKSLQTSGASEKQVEVSFEQNGKVIASNHGVLRLKKEPFSIVVDFSKSMSILLNSSFDDRIYSLSLERKQLVGLPEFNTNNSIAVALGNPNQVVYMDEGSSYPLYYENDNENTFNSVEKNGDRLRCVYHVKLFSHYDAPDPVAVHLIDNPIYMVFAPTEMVVNTPNAVKFQGKHIKIEWED